MKALTSERKESRWPTGLTCISERGGWGCFSAVYFSSPTFVFGGSLSGSLWANFEQEELAGVPYWLVLGVLHLLQRAGCTNAAAGRLHCRQDPGIAGGVSKRALFTCFLRICYTGIATILTCFMGLQPS